MILFGEKCIGIGCKGRLETVGGLFSKKNYGNSETPLCERCFSWEMERMEYTEKVVETCHFCGKDIYGGDDYYECVPDEGVDPHTGRPRRSTNDRCNYLNKPKCKDCVAKKEFGHVCDGCSISLRMHKA